MNKNGVVRMDMDTLVRMRDAFEYQEQALRAAYPEEDYSNHQNYFCVDMLILYTMIFFIRRREIGKYTLPYLDLSEQPLSCRIAYRFCRGAARLKFGGRLTEEEPSKELRAKQESAVS